MLGRHGLAFVALTAAACTLFVPQSRAQSDDSRAPARPTESLPNFLPAYFEPALTIRGHKLTRVANQTKDGLNQYLYESSELGIHLVISNAPCSAGACETFFDNSFGAANQLATKNSGSFTNIAFAEFDTAWGSGGAQSIAFAFRLPTSLSYWEFTVAGDSALPADYLDTIRNLVNRQRYEQASAAGVIEMGRWDISFRQLAEALLKDGHKAEAADVFKAIVATTPTDYEAQIQYADLVSASAEARESAKAVYENSETPELISRAAILLKADDPESRKFPLLAKGEKGLQAIIVALPPFDPHVLADAAQLAASITKIPTKVVQLSEDWKFGEPDRIPNQRQIQQFLAQRSATAIDFKDWTLDKYKSELFQLAAGADALTKYNITSLLAGLSADTAQYAVEPYLDKLAKILAKYRSGDNRTAFIGVTEKNISFGDANFVFGAGAKMPEGFTTLASYHVMEAKYSGASSESHKRLVERLAKELVPAIVSTLGIPRPADPNDPASYASGIERLDQKSLTLSAPTQLAIDKLR